MKSTKGRDYQWAGLAEEKWIKEEDASRAANIAHVKQINNATMALLMNSELVQAGGRFQRRLWNQQSMKWSPNKWPKISTCSEAEKARIICYRPVLQSWITSRRINFQFVSRLHDGSIAHYCTTVFSCSPIKIGQLRPWSLDIKNLQGRGAMATDRWVNMRHCALTWKEMARCF